VVLSVVAFQLGADSRTLLIGAAAPQEDRQRVHEAIAAFEEVNEILHLLTMHLRPNSVLVNAEIHVVNGIDTDQIEELIEQITHAIREQMPEANQVFIELRPPQQPGPE
jgi:divalent metal cation (Fe/Co/Zn/Cd) transporter